ncbi:protoglobin domain-containing protein [Spirobacillus cienkowskii]|uniref:protoglobin domain-containing protein n=1 Tax=Spirobacillus cienkowskii TaxID=495820 RepID=UPI0030CB9138
MNTQDEFSLFVSQYFLDNSISKFEKAINFNENVKEKAKKLSPYIKENIENIINEFYEFNLNNENAKKYFKNQEEIEYLKKLNTNYFQYLFLGPFDERYYIEKLKIGYVHYLRGITTDIYMSAIGNLGFILSKIWLKIFNDPALVAEAQLITGEVLLLEIYYTINSYYIFSERKFIEEKNKVKEILDNINEGYFIINKDLIISDVVSKSCFSIFNTDISGKKVEDIIFENNIEKSELIFLTIKQYFSGIFDIDSLFVILPEIVKIKNNKIVKLKYTAVLDKNKIPEKLIIQASDVTDQINLQKKHEEKNRNNSILINIIRNRSKFDLFLKEIIESNVILLDCENISQGKNVLQQLKDDFSKFELIKIVTLISNLELELLEKEKKENFNYKEFFSLSSYIISNTLHKFLEDNHDVLKITV